MSKLLFNIFLNEHLFCTSIKLMFATNWNNKLLRQTLVASTMYRSEKYSTAIGSCILTIILKGFDTVVASWNREVTEGVQLWKVVSRATLQIQLHGGQLNGKLKLLALVLCALALHAFAQTPLKNPSALLKIHRPGRWIFNKRPDRVGYENYE